MTTAEILRGFVAIVAVFLVIIAVHWPFTVGTLEISLWLPVTAALSGSAVALAGLITLATFVLNAFGFYNHDSP